MLIDLESGALECVESFRVAVEIGAAVLEQHVGEVVEWALGGDVRIKLAYCSCCEISWIGKSSEAIALAFFVEFLECGSGHQEFAADFEVHGNACFLELLLGNRKRHRTDGANVEGYVFTGSPVATSNATHEMRIIVAER